MYNRPLDRLTELLTKKVHHTDFFALKDVSFSLRKGQSLGIVGDNGSGKSTLLQIIAGVLTPTSGAVECTGSVLGLLELGVGFHIEFTGRQNIFLYGDVLGLPRAVIRQHLTQIIDFAELGAFIDYPLKTYSTGMRMRLAFSLVAALDPDILIVDEALTVGDNYFQKKCLDHITQMKALGRMIIFCSHNTYQIGLFCEETLWLQQGIVKQYGETLPVLSAYQAYQFQKGSQHVQNGHDQYAHTPVHITSVEILNHLPIKRGDDLQLRIHTACISDTTPFHVMVSLKFSADFGVYATGTHLAGQPPLMGKHRAITITYPNIPLLGGYYWFHVRIFDDQGMILYHEQILSEPALEVRKENNERGVCYLENHWDIR